MAERYFAAKRFVVNKININCRESWEVELCAVHRTARELWLIQSKIYHVRLFLPRSGLGRNTDHAVDVTSSQSTKLTQDLQDQVFLHNGLLLLRSCSLIERLQENRIFLRGYICM